MPSVVDLTAILGGVGGIGGAAAAVWALLRQSRKDRITEERDKDATDVASWTSLNSALDREIQRLHAEMDRQGEDHERQMTKANTRIAELERDVESLQRLLRLTRPPGERDAPL